MIDDLLLRFHMAVEHRAGAFEPHLMRHPHDLEPTIPVYFVLANLSAGPWCKYFSPSARARVEPRLHQFLKNLFETHLVFAGKEINFNHGEGLDVEGWIKITDGPHHLRVIRPGERGMQSAHHVDLCNPFS